MAITVTKGLRIDADNCTLDCTAKEIDMIRVLLNRAARDITNSVEYQMFADSCNTVINNALVANGD